MNLFCKSQRFSFFLVYLFLLAFSLVFFFFLIIGTTSCGLVPCSLLLLSLLLPFFFFCLFINLTSYIALLNHFLIGGYLTLHPGMRQYFFQGESVLRIIIKHSLDQVLELLGEEVNTTRLGPTMELPEHIPVVTIDHFVISIILLGSLKGRTSSYHNE